MSLRFCGRAALRAAPPRGARPLAFCASPPAIAQPKVRINPTAPWRIAAARLRIAARPKPQWQSWKRALSTQQTPSSAPSSLQTPPAPAVAPAVLKAADAAKPATKAGEEEEAEVDETVLPWSQRMSRLVKVYGPVALGFHFGIEAVVFGGFYLAVENGLDVGSLLASVCEYTGYQIPVSPGTSAIAMAYLLTVSLTGFPRTVLTVVATPAIARRLGWSAKKLPPAPPAAAK
ncbi:hypothetical protein M885DRAFT_620087 [Pelagophyceae sp. CCMP2097]|nr:hypothetical protein M885DRAFT_620087 [Pelagophyceae sp. CCMP2097]